MRQSDFMELRIIRRAPGHAQPARQCRKALLDRRQIYRRAFLDLAGGWGHQRGDAAPVAKAVFGPLIIGERPSGEIGRYHDLVWEQYASATKELERYMADRGRVLLSIDATDGDKMLFALVPPDVTTRWRDKSRWVLTEQPERCVYPVNSEWPLRALFSAVR